MSGPGELAQVLRTVLGVLQEPSVAPAASLGGGDPNASKPPSLICPLCRRAFAGKNRRQHLEHHIYTHTGEKPFACLYCPYRSSRKDTLLSHLRKWHPHHQKDRP